MSEQTGVDLSAHRHPDAPAPGELISSHYHRCFGCGPDHASGLHLQFVADEGLAGHGSFVVSEEHQGAPGLAHGGLLAAAVDEAFGSLGYLLRRPMVTAKLETEYRRPVPVGTTLHIRVQVDRIDGRKVWVSAQARDGGPDGRLVITSTGLFVLVDMSHFHHHGRREDLAAAASDPHAQAAAQSFEVNP